MIEPKRLGRGQVKRGFTPHTSKQFWWAVNLLAVSLWPAGIKPVWPCGKEVAMRSRTHALWHHCYYWSAEVITSSRHIYIRSNVTWILQCLECEQLCHCNIPTVGATLPCYNGIIHVVVYSCMPCTHLMKNMHQVAYVNNLAEPWLALNQTKELYFEWLVSWTNVRMWW